MRTVAIEGAKRLGNIKSIKNVIPKTGDNIWVDEQSTIKQKIQDIIKKSQQRNVVKSIIILAVAFAW
jgi:hypothetical protein